MKKILKNKYVQIAGISLLAFAGTRIAVKSGILPRIPVIGGHLQMVGSFFA